MTILVKLDSEGNIVKYPYSVEELNKDFPNVSFPSNLESVLNKTKYNFAIVKVDESADKYEEDIFHTIEEDLPKQNKNGEWVVQYKRSEKPLLDIQKIICNVIQDHIETIAKAKGYDNAVVFATYAASENAFQEEAAAFVKWRSKIWVDAFALIDEFSKNGLGEVKSSDDIISLLS